MARASFQTKIFLAALASSVIALAVAGILFATTMRRQIDAHIATTLVAEARLAAELLTRVGTSTPKSVVELDGEADRLGKLIDARVTFIAGDGRVVGDSAETLEGIAAMENHLDRPEIAAARAAGLGTARRHSA